MSKALKTIFKLIKQPTTWAGLGTIVATAGAQSVGIKINDIGQALALILGGGFIAYDQSAKSPVTAPSSGD